MTATGPAAGALVRDPDGSGWIARSHAVVQTILRDPVWSSDPRRANAFADRWGSAAVGDVVGELLSKVLLFTDAADHVRLRGLVSRAFTPRSVIRLRPRIAALTEELLAPIRQRGQMDVIDDLAFPLPVTVICELLGVPAEDRELFRAQTRDLAPILDRVVTVEQVGRAAGALMTFVAYLVPLFDERRRRPGDDLVSALVAVEEGGDRLAADELLATVVLLLVAGHETTTNLIGNGLLALLRHPDQRAWLRAHPEKAAAAVDELLRYDPPVRVTVRVATEDTVLAGRSIRAGEQVVCDLVAANRDPDVFRSPERLDLARDARRHLSFGGGPHHCLGAALARAEGEVALAALNALPDLALAVDEPVWRPLDALRGLESLPVTFRRMSPVTSGPDRLVSTGRPPGAMGA